MAHSSGGRPQPLLPRCSRRPRCNAAGTCTLDANQGGNTTQYSAAAQVQQKVTVHAVAQVNATLSAHTTATPGTDLTYTYKVANAGPASATGLTNTLVLPSGVTLVSASGSPSSPSSAAVQWEPVSRRAPRSPTP